MKKRVSWIVMIILVLVFAYWYAHIAKMNMIYDKGVDNSEYISMGILEDQRVEQKFVCREDTMDGIYVKCQVTGDVTDVNVCYRITSGSPNTPVASGSYPASELKASKFNKLTFDTIEDSRDKEYTLSIWSDPVSARKGVSFYYQPETEEGTELTIGGSAVNGTMIMRTVTNRFDMETFCVVIIFIAFIKNSPVPQVGSKIVYE